METDDDVRLLNALSQRVERGQHGGVEATSFRIYASYPVQRRNGATNSRKPSSGGSVATSCRTGWLKPAARATRSRICSAATTTTPSAASSSSGFITRTKIELEVIA